MFSVPGAGFGQITPSQSKKNKPRVFLTPGFYFFLISNNTLLHGFGSHKKIRVQHMFFFIL